MSNRKSILINTALFILLVGSLIICTPTISQAATAPLPAKVKIDPFLKQLVAMEDLQAELEELADELEDFEDILADSGLPPEAAWMTKYVWQRAANPQKILSTFYDYVLKDYDQKNVTEVIKWLQSPLGKKYKALEYKSRSQESEDERAAYVRLLESFPPQEARLIMSERLEKAWEQADLTLNVIFPIFRLWFPNSQRSVDRSIDKVLKELEKEIREPLRKDIVSGNLYVLEDLSIDEFKKLLEFAESDAGKWYGRVFHRGVVVAFEEQVQLSRDYLEDFLTSIESEQGGMKVLKKTFPPGERFIALRKRDPFKPLVSEDEGLLVVMRPRPKKVVFKNLRDKLKNFPTIPLEVYKKIKSDNPDLYANLEYHQELFNDLEELKTMTEEEYKETLELYRKLIKRANQTRSNLVKTPLQTKYKEIKFVGVIWKGEETFALVETKGKKGHSVKKGTLVGPNLGVVDAIGDDQIVVVERFMDYRGEVLAKRQTIKFSGVS